MEALSHVITLEASTWSLNHVMIYVQCPTHKIGKEGECESVALMKYLELKWPFGHFISEITLINNAIMTLIDFS